MMKFKTVVIDIFNSPSLSAFRESRSTAAWSSTVVGTDTAVKIKIM